jgi:metal-responsive CopG/Arc/MetJ family transcriptional regulator
MTAILINIPESIKEESTKAAKYLGLTRTEFIKQAIMNELDNFKKLREEAKIAKAFKAMKKSKTYLAESNEIMDGFDVKISEDEAWWSKK